MTERAVGVVGAGTMGSGIAQLALQSGFEVVLRDVDDDLLAEGVDRVEAGLAEAEDRGYVDDADAARERLESTTDLGPLERATFVIEAVPERMELKKEVFGDLADATDEETVLGTNTSSLPVTEIASATDSPERVIGTHFFNPPVKMDLLELVTGHHTSEATVDRAEALAEDLGKESVLVDDFPGFATSRLGVALGMEAARMVQEGVASPEDIDRAMELGYGHPMGPLRLGDYNGWDVREEIGEALAEELGREVFRPPQVIKRMVRAGDLGKKTGQGFYDWTDGESEGDE